MTTLKEKIRSLLDSSRPDTERLSIAETDALGELANISMGTSATSLAQLVNRKVEISTPCVSFARWDDICELYDAPCVLVQIAFTQGLKGNNVLILKEKDAKVITDLMMGGDGTNTQAEVTELHLSAISEAMNQMIGSAATSLASMTGRTIDISFPNSKLLNLKETKEHEFIEEFLQREFAKVMFNFKIDQLVDSEMMHLYQSSFARDLFKMIAENH